MSYRIAISNTVHVPVKLSFDTPDGTRQFKFKLLCNRVPQERIDSFQGSSEEKCSDFLKEVTTGWADQRFITDEQGEPAEFNPDSFAAMLSATGVPLKLYGAYIDAVVPKKT